MLRRGTVFLGAFAALALSDPGTPVRRALKASAGVSLDEDGLGVDADVDLGDNGLGVDADVDLGEDGLGVDVGLSLGSETYPEDPPPPDTYPETVTVTETMTKTLPGDTITETKTVTETETAVAETITETTTETQAAETITETTTETQDADTVTETVPAETTTAPGATITPPAETITNVETDTVERTIVETLTIPTSYFITTTISDSVVTTQLTKDYSTIVTTQISSIQGPPVTVPGPGETHTVSTPPLTLTEVSACPAPTNDFSAADAAPLDPRSDLTWGCKPGYICNPPKPEGCNFWIDTPADNYVCAPEDCVRAPPYYAADWGENQTGWIPPTEGYYYLDPRAFGLSFDIFEPPEEVVTTIHGKETTILTGNYASQTDLTHYPMPSSATGGDYERRGVRVLRAIEKRDNSMYPPVCFGDCNNGILESMNKGKSDLLCEVGSRFRETLEGCMACVTKYDSETPASGRTYLEDKFKQYQDFCEGSDAEPTEGGDDGDGPESQVTEGEVSTRSQAEGNTQTEAEPISSTTASADESTTEAGQSPTEAGQSPSETASEQASETGSGQGTAAPSTSPTSGTGGGSDGNNDDSDGNTGDEGSSPGGSGGSGSGSGDEDSSPGGSGSSGGSGSGDGDSSPGGSGGSGDGGSTPGDSTGGGSTPDGTAGDSPDSTPSHQPVPAGVGMSSVPGLAAAFLPLLGGLHILL